LRGKTSSHVCCAASRRSVLSKGRRVYPGIQTTLARKSASSGLCALGASISSFVNFEPLRKEPRPDVGLVCTEMVGYCTIEVGGQGN